MCDDCVKTVCGWCWAFLLNSVINYSKLMVNHCQWQRWVFTIPFMCEVQYEEDSMRLVPASLLLISVSDYGESWFNIVSDSGEFLLFLYVWGMRRTVCWSVFYSIVSLTTASHGSTLLVTAVSFYSFFMCEVWGGQYEAGAGHWAVFYFIVSLTTTSHGSTLLVTAVSFYSFFMCEVWGGQYEAGACQSSTY